MTEKKRRAVAHDLADAVRPSIQEYEPSSAVHGVSVGYNYGTVNVFYDSASRAAAGGHDPE